MSISVDGAGLISGLLLRPYLSASWAQVDRELAALAPDASLLAARVSPGGSCTPVHQVAASAARPLGSMFKLFVLGALAHQIAAGAGLLEPGTDGHRRAEERGQPGSLQDVPAGTRVPVRQTAAKMISISDNTAADMLIHLVGRSAVQAQDRQWSDHAALNVPFLTGPGSLSPENHQLPGAGEPVPEPCPGPARGVPCLLRGPAAAQPGASARRASPGMDRTPRHRHHRMVRLAG